MGWTWKIVREHFKDRQRAAHLTQKQIAAAGGIEQSAVSKLVHNDNLGPAVEVFLNAIDGLGIPVSEFFRQLERAQATSAHAHDLDAAIFLTRDDDHIRELARVLRRAIDRHVRRVLEEQQVGRKGKGRKRTG